MRKSLFAAVLASLGVAGLAAPASAAPSLIGPLDINTSIVDVRMDGMRGHHRGHMMGRHHMRGHMMGRHRGHMMRHHRM